MEKNKYSPFKIMKNHAKDCYAVSNVKNKTWDKAWTTIERVDRVNGSKRSPTQRGSVEWLFVICNCTHCPAVLAIKGDHMLAGAPTK